MAYIGTSITQGPTVNVVPAAGLLVVGPNGILTALNPAADAVSAALNSQVIVMGTLISQLDDAIETVGDGVRVTLYDSARLYGGDTGVTFGGSGVLANAGEILGNAHGVRAGDFVSVLNTGVLQGDVGVALGGGPLVNHGTILGIGTTGIAVQGSAIRIENHGTLSATRAVVFTGLTNNNMLENTGTIIGSVRGSDGREAVTNAGVIHGFVSLGAGSDHYDGGGGTVSGHVNGDAGDDTLAGGAGRETMYGGDGADSLFGGAGDDSLDGGAGGDELAGGEGIDLLSYSFFVVGGSSASVTVDLASGDAWGGWAEGDIISGFEQLQGSLAGDRLGGLLTADTIWGHNGNDTITSASGDDWLRGDAGADSLLGGEGVDVLLGGILGDRLLGEAGNDRLFGQDGADTLDGGAGRDWMTGGNDADVFRFAALADSGVLAATRDRVQDFRTGVDKVDLSAIDAVAGGLTNEAFTFLGTAVFSGVSGQLRMTSAGGNTYLHADVDGDRIADFSVEFAGAIPFVVGDIIL